MLALPAVPAWPDAPAVAAAARLHPHSRAAVPVSVRVPGAVASEPAKPEPDPGTAAPAEPVDPMEVPGRSCLWIPKDWECVWSVFSCCLSTPAVGYPDHILSGCATIHRMPFPGDPLSKKLYSGEDIPKTGRKRCLFSPYGTASVVIQYTRELRHGFDGVQAGFTVQPNATSSNHNFTDNQGEDTHGS